MPFEHSAVKIEDEFTEEHGSYINASHIHCPLSATSNELIGTQSPLPTTVHNFWRMIWAQKVFLIVMLCNPKTENNRCLNYYSRGQTHGSFTTEVVSDIRMNESVFKVTLKLIKKDPETGKKTSRLVEHLRFEKWPDHGVPGPKYHRDLAHLPWHMVLKREETKSDAPIVTHCSAGVGRSGTI